MTDNIFETQPTLDQFVGEGKKYADNNAVAKALTEKDAFIARLLEEKRQVEASLREQVNIQAFKDRIDALEAAQVERAVPTPPPTATPAPPAPAGVDEAAVQRIMDQREAANRRTRNLMEVQSKLTDVFGPDYPTRVKAKAQELGVDMARLNEMAAETPSLFYAAIGLTGPAPRPVDGAPPATQRNSAVPITSMTKKNNAYYSEMRRTKPAEYFTPRIAAEEYAEAKRQGPAFYEP